MSVVLDWKMLAVVLSFLGIRTGGYGLRGLFESGMLQESLGRSPELT